MLAFANSELSKLKINEIRTNKLKNVFVLECESAEITRVRLNDITKIGEWDVHCFIPNKDKVKDGVIFPIDIEENLDELMKEMKILNSTRDPSKIIKLTRLRKKTQNGFVPSTSVRVTFESDYLPDKIAVQLFVFKVRPYVYSPRQCFKCQRLGHTEDGCKSQVRCLKCSGNHKVQQCTTNIFACANCKGNHKANSDECRFIYEAKKIEKLKANGMTYLEARNQTQNYDRDFPVLDPIIGNGIVTPRQENQNSENVKTVVEIHHAANSQVHIPQRNRWQTDNLVPPPKKTYNTVETQTDKTPEINKPIFQGREFFISLRNFLAEMISMVSLSKESKHARHKIIEGMIRNNFRIDPTETVEKVQNNQNTPCLLEETEDSQPIIPEGCDEISERNGTSSEEDVIVQGKRKEEKEIKRQANWRKNNLSSRILI